MQTVTQISELRALIQQAKQQGKRVGFVPTMGNLHDGHLQLIDIAHQHCDFVVSSIFVNPLQFGAGEDLDKYPRTLEADQQKLAAHQCDLLFTPTEQEIYPKGREQQTQVEVPILSDIYCGASRPGHFQGVATVVCKLFNIVAPDLAVFGQKDYQQLMVIRKMTEDLSLPVTIIGAPIVRAESGLALSSRNGYLSAEQLETAALINKTLRELATQIATPKADLRQLEEQAQQRLEQAGFRRDYLHICNQNDLTLATDSDQPLVILIAAYLGTTRLIDNLEVER